MNLSFEKWHGAKNNFIVCHITKNDDYLFESLKKNTPKLCTHDGSGIGADGVLVLYYENVNDLIPLELIILNSDGSVAKTCGNGIRCAVSSLRNRLLELNGSAPELIELQGAERKYICRFDKNGIVNTNMGVCYANEEVDNFSAKNAFVQMKLKEFQIKVDSVGIFNISNEHVVLEVSSLDKDLLFDFAKDIQNADVWDGINVHFIKEKSKKTLDTLENKSIEQSFDVLIWERGVGPTAACGSGACSIGKFIYTQGFMEDGNWVEIAMPGGNLYTKEVDGEMALAGNCAKVFSGNIEI